MPSTNAIFVFGPSRSGKSSLIQQIGSSDARFLADTPITLGLEFTVFRMNSERVQFWELAGSPGFREPISFYFPGMSLGLYCIDLSRSKNTPKEEIKRDLMNFKSKNPSAPIWLVGTKADLLSEAAASEALQGVLLELNDLISASALTSSLQGIEDFKSHLVQKIAEKNAPTPVENEIEGFHNEDIDLGDPNQVSPKPTPRSYYKLFRAPQEFNGDAALVSARALLNDYTKGNTFFLSRLHRYACGHVNRHYVTQVTAIVKQIDNGSIASFNDLMAELNSIEIANPHGSLARRIDFIRKKASEWGIDASEMQHVADDAVDHGRGARP